MTSEVQEPPIRLARLSRRAQLVLKLAMVLIPPLLLLGALDVVAYLWEKQQAQGEYAWELVASRRIEMEVHESPGAGYTLMMPGRHYEYQGIPVEINNQGLRNPETPYQKPDGVYRILNMGDSIAMGWGVRQEESYGQLLPEYLADQNARRVEVINAGVPGWNLENELAFLQGEGLKYSPDLVILDFTLPNDVLGDSALINDRPAPIEFLRAHTYFWPFLTIQMRWVEARSQGKDRIPVIDPPHFAAAYFPENANDPKWDQLTGLIASMQAELDKAEIPFLVVLFPLEDQAIDPAFSTLPQKVLGKKMDQLGIPLVDLLPANQRACASKPGGACILEDRYLFADVWMHPSPLGHQIAAQQIAEALHIIIK